MDKAEATSIAAVMAVCAAACAFAAPDAARRVEAEAEARRIVARMSARECVWQLMMDAPASEKAGLPKYHWWNEALHGVARCGVATVFPQAIGAAATFDAELERKMADVISTEGRAKHNEFRAKGQRGIYQGLTFWSPNVNMFRDPLWGRGHETFGEDPYLAGAMGTAFVKGMQGDDPKFLKVAACAKHYAVHSGPEKLRHGFNVDLDSRDLYEYYLPAFKMLVMDGQVESVMGAYSAVNGVPCCASRRLLTDILRGEWGFKGHVVSDVGAVGDIKDGHHYTDDAVKTCLAAIDAGLDLCSEGTYHALFPAVDKGEVKKEQLVEPLVHLLTTRILLGNVGGEATPWDELSAKDIATPAHKALALKVAEESIVLVKNNGVLPLDKAALKDVSIWGRCMEEAVLMGNYEGIASEPVSVMTGIAEEVGPGMKLCGPGEEGSSDTVICCIGLTPGDEGEERDKKDCRLSDWQMGILRNLRKNKNRRMIAVVFGGSPIDLREVNEICDAVLLAWYPGEQGGRAIARTIFGKNNPGGRLPITYPGSYDGLKDIKDYSLEGRTYRYAKAKPLYPFGYGLSYTTFAYDSLEVAASKDGVMVSARVTNTGKVAGDEVVQLYVRSPEGSGDRRIHHLEGFRRLRLGPGEAKAVLFSLSTDQLMQFGMDGGQSLAKGRYTIFVGGGQPGFADGVLSGSVGL